MKAHAQRGLTLIEMVIAITLLAIMISAIVFSFDGDKSRAQVLIAAMNEYGSALERMKTDTSCYPRNLDALFDRTQSEGAAKSFCQADLSKQWNGPYVKSAPAKASSVDSAVRAIMLAQISPELELRIGRIDSAFGSGGGGGTGVPTSKWFIVADNVPSGIVTQAEVACNGIDDSQQQNISGQRKCAISGRSQTLLGYNPAGLNLQDHTANGGSLGSVAMLFNETRK